MGYAEVEETGEISSDAANDMNVPVNIWLTKDDGDDGIAAPWVLRACLYMPRKGLVRSDAFESKCRDREPLAEIVRSKWLPLYQNAVLRLEAIVSGKGKDLYFWDGPEEDQDA